MRTQKVIQSFNAGELSPLMDARIDQSKYQSGCRTLENFYPLIYGGAERRPGTYFVARVKSTANAANWANSTSYSVNDYAIDTADTLIYRCATAHTSAGSGTTFAEDRAANSTYWSVDTRVRLVDFIYSEDDAYVLEFGNQYMRVYRDYGRFVGSLLADTAAWAGALPYVIGDFVSASDNVIYRCIRNHTSDAGGGDGTGGDPASGGNPTQWAVADLTSDLYPIYELVTPYLSADLPELKFEHSADVKYITHPSYEPRKLSRTSATTFTLEETAYDDGPFRDRNTNVDYTISVAAPAWADATAYVIGDAVTYSAVNYRCIVAHTSATGGGDGAGGEPDTNTTQWEQVNVIDAGNSVTLTASGHTPFDTDHDPPGALPTSKSLTGALWEIVHIREEDGVSHSFSTTESSDTVRVFKGSVWDYVTNGTWDGTIKLERTYDDAVTWEVVHTTTSESNSNSKVDGTEKNGDAYYRITMSVRNSGTAICSFAVRS
jgi:hypothetical protein